MLKTFCAAAVCLLLSIGAIAQKPPAKFGEISMEDMKMTVYDKDSSASAVVLFDYGNAYISVGNEIQLYFERHIRIKILKKEGLEWANANIQLYHSGSAEEKVIALKASTYNLMEGRMVESKMSKDGVFKEKFNRNYNLQKFTLPDVREGSVIEYSYKVASSFYTNFPNWQFQKSIPVKWSEYWAMIPTVFIYERYMQGYVPVSIYNVEEKSYFNEKVNAHHWVCENVPAFKEEPYITCEDDYISRINFALSHINYSTHTEEIMGSWPKLNEGLLESSDFGKVISGSSFLKEQTTQAIQGITDPLVKVSSIVNYIKQNVEWDGTEDIYPDNLKKVLEKKKGTAADINIMLASMLQKAGFEVDPVLLSTRDHGIVRQSYPMAKQFNYVVCALRLEDKVILLDATEKYLPYNVIPSRCLNGQGLVISKTKHGWIDLTSKAKSKTTVMADLVLNAEGSLKGKLQFSRDGYDAWEMREEFHAKGETEYVKDYVTGKSWQFEKSEFQDIKDIEKTAKEVHEVQIDEHVTQNGPVMYISPFIDAQIDENPFKQDTRIYPVNYSTAMEQIYVCKITVPEGYTVDELPKSKVLGLPGNAGRFLFNTSMVGNVISITSNFQINKSLFLQAEYEVLKEFYNQVVSKQAEQIVLKKK
jgi:Transglutaminase-like superfamily.